MVVGVCKLSLMLAQSESLKDKRAVLRHIKDKVQHKFNCAIAEVGDNESLSSAELGFAVVSNELGFTQSLVHKILNYVEDLAAAKIVGDEQDYVNYGDESLDSGKGTWEPDDEPTVLRPPQRARPPAPKPTSKEDGDLPDWLPARFMEGADPEK